VTDWVEIAALVSGPIGAVVLTLWREKKRQERERRLSVLRQMLLTRANTSDPGFSQAVNLVPIEFGRSQKVMTAWDEFSRAAAVQSVNSGNIPHLIRAMMIDLKYSVRAASQVAETPYVAVGLGDQQRLVADVLKAVVRIAVALETASSPYPPAPLP
jgi:hypothetical protein